MRYVIGWWLVCGHGLLVTCVRGEPLLVSHQVLVLVLHVILAVGVLVATVALLLRRTRKEYLDEDETASHHEELLHQVLIVLLVWVRIRRLLPCFEVHGVLADLLAFREVFHLLLEALETPSTETLLLLPLVVLKPLSRLALHVLVQLLELRPVLV